jgi:hypothetical protein
VLGIKKKLPDRRILGKTVRIVNFGMVQGQQ